MQSKTTRAFRTISEAADELDLQPHVLRFWESKFPSFKPIKRGGGRRFYRPEDIEFLRGIKILLHDERHPIKDVQKLIKVKGSARVAELGRSVRRAAIPKDVKDTILVPDHIQGAAENAEDASTFGAEDVSMSQSEDFASESFFPSDIGVETETEQMPEAAEDQDAQVTSETELPGYAQGRSKPVVGTIYSIEAVPTGLTDEERSELEGALARLKDLKRQWQAFKQDTPPQ